MSCFTLHKDGADVSVIGVEEMENVTLYKIRITLNNVTWTVLHRYKDFDELHSKLISDHGVSKDLLPPKRAIRNKCPKFIEQRREGLDAYLKNVFNYLQLTMPKEFAKFLNFPEYDIVFLLQNLAMKLYNDGDKMLEKSNAFTTTPLELYAISQRLKQPCSSFELSDSKYDFSHVLDFCSQLKVLRIEGSHDPVGTSNIIPNRLQFDLSPFKSLTELIVVGCPMQNIVNTGTLRNTLKTLKVSRTSARKISDIVLCDVIHKDIENNAQDMTWNSLLEINLSKNTITEIDKSIKLLPKVQKLGLSRNKISEITNLVHLPHLSHLNMSQNHITTCVDLHSKIGKITSINLSQNSITSLAGFSKLYSLEILDLSCNQITDVEEVQHICNLPCLEDLRLTANPVASVVDYRVRVIEQFNFRMLDICLDNEKASQRELDTARVLQALRIVKEGKTPSYLHANDYAFATIPATGGSGL